MTETAVTGARIYLSPPDVGEAERKLLLEAFDSNWVAPVGPDLDAFEAQVAELVGVRHAVALASGTAALHLALVAAGVRRGDTVLVPSFTFAARSLMRSPTSFEPVNATYRVFGWSTTTSP